MPRFRFLAGFLALILTVGCKAQTPKPASSSTLNRHIELLVRSEYDLPSDVTVSIGARSASHFTGYQTLPVTVTHGGTSQVIDFLISNDNTKLAHMDVMDLTKTPADSIDIAGRPIRGNPAAKVTVIGFDDLECPFCARMNAELFPGTLDHYKDQVRFIYKNDPLTSLHPWAMHAAVDADCLAAESGPVYWNYVDYVHSHGGEITGSERNLKKSFAALDRIAREEATLGKLDMVKLNACLAKQDETGVRASQQEAEALDIEGTPVLFVDGEKVDGAVPQDQLWVVIDRALRAVGETPPPAAPAAKVAAAAKAAPAAAAAPAGSHSR